MRRTIDILVSLTALLILSPVLLLVGLAVNLDSPGGPLYRARRVGQHGRIFSMWKFRTMRAGSAPLGRLTFRADPRVTRVGRILRRTKLDELPQFINVLMGEMTLVGPRPEAPEIVDRYSREQRLVLSVKPGITGQVQLETGCEADEIPAGPEAEEYYLRNLMPGKVQRDIEYLRTHTSWNDARIVLGTAGYVLRAIVPRRHRSTE